MSKPKIICLMGPTASGKTATAIELVQRFNCEIISVDSALVYKGMDIGTAKPTAAELKLAPHRLIDICDPADIYSTGRYLEDVAREIKVVLALGKVPLLVGGTMLYHHALQFGLSPLPKSNAQIRAQIEAQAARVGWPAMHQHLQTIDAKAAESIKPNDRQRISRALEVHQLTGKPISQLQQNNQVLDYNFINLILEPADRSQLHQRIALRFDQMLETGFMLEMQRLYARDDLNIDLPSMRTVGYRQGWQYLNGDYDLATMREKSIIATRQLAKRQLTWLRRWRDATRYDCLRDDVAAQVCASLSSEL